MRHRVVLLVADRYTDSGVAIALDVFHTANVLAAQAGRAAPFHVEVASAEGGEVRGASGVAAVFTRSLRAVARADVVLVPGVWAESASDVDAILAQPSTAPIVRALLAAHARGALVGSSCGGAFYLAEAGLLDERVCTTTWWLGPHLQARAPRARVDATRALVVDDRVVTAGAVFAQADLTLSLVARFAGPSTARTCARLLLLDRHPGQAPYMALRYLRTDDVTVRRAERWARAHLADDFDVPTLARRAGTSARTLARRLDATLGLSPLAFVQRLRVEAAVHLLETTTLAFDEIAARVGYEDASALRRLVRREAAATPREIRQRAAGTARSDAARAFSR